jgi:hypothetical protein
MKYWKYWRPTTRYAPVIILLLLHWGIAVSSVRDKSTTFDEISHLTAGYSYWLTGDFRLHPENGMFPQRWGALPLLLGSYQFPSLDQLAWWESDEYAVGYHFFYDEGNDLDAMLLSGRAMMALLSVALGSLVYGWSRQLFGPAGGISSLALYAFSPTMLAHGPLITSDLAAALFFTASVGALWMTLHRVSPATMLCGTLAMAGLFLSKMSAVLIVPMGLLLLAIRLVSRAPLTVVLRHSREIRSRRRQLVVFAVTGLIQVVTVVTLLWASCSFRYSAFREAEPDRDRLGWEDVTPIPSAVDFARDHHVLPEPYLYGFADVLHQAKTRRAFLNGQHSWRGWRSFFPYCLAVKTPLALFAILLAAAGGAVARWRAARSGPHDSPRAAVGKGLYDTAPLWVLLAVYWAFAINSHLNIGHRHLLPTYPALFILAGGAAYWLTTRHRVVSVLVLGAAAAFVAESVIRWPHYLAYFNQLVGGPRHGYRHLVDSSLDWGQDLPGLKRWLDRHGLNGPDSTPVYLSYFGTGKPADYDIEATRLPGHFDHWRRRESYELTGGVYCISATMLQSVYSLVPGPWAVPYERAYQNALSNLRTIAQTTDPVAQKRLSNDFVRHKLALFEQLRFARLCAFLRHREPDDHVGYSILIYRLTDQDVFQALHGRPAELLPDVQVVGVEYD